MTLRSTFPRVDEIGLDWKIVGYSLVCAVGRDLHLRVIAGFACDSRFVGITGTDTTGSQFSPSSHAVDLVGVQVALAVTLLFGAGLLLRSFQELGRVSAGFNLNASSRCTSALPTERPPT